MTIFLWNIVVQYVHKCVMLWNKYNLIYHLFHSCLVEIAYFFTFWLWKNSFLKLLFSSSSLALFFTFLILHIFYFLLCLLFIFKCVFYLPSLCSYKFSSMSCPSFLYLADYLVHSRHSINTLWIRDYWFNEENFRDQNARVGKLVLCVCS